MSAPTRVTTLIPVFNGAEFVATAVRSALDQRNVDVEVIVIDDGSTDDTPQVLRAFGNDIRVLTQKNAGHVCARNNGAALSSGQWMAFLDADDEWLPDKLSKQLAAAANGDIGMVYTDRENFGEIDRTHVIGSSPATSTMYDGDLFERLLFGNFVTVSSAMVRRDWYERLGGFDERLRVCEDWDMWLRFSAAGGIAAVCREPLTRYRWSQTSMSYNQQRMCDGRVGVVRKALASERGRAVSASARRRALAMAWGSSAWYAAPTHPGSAMKWYLRSSFYQPLNLAIYKNMLKCCLGQP